MRGFVHATMIAAVMVLFASGSAAARLAPSDCTYELRVWNVYMKNSVMVKQVMHSYDSLSPEEIESSTGCTVCSEDQEVIDIPPLPPFSVCYRLVPRVRALLSYLMKSSAPIHTIIGYHVIKSRGPLDQQGNRTGFSNHSFGTAIDINPEQNGLYDACTVFGPHCRLLRGGAWRPGTPGTLERDGKVVMTFKQEGFRWGGEIAGRQKDFMHFSLTGY